MVQVWRELGVVGEGDALKLTLHHVVHNGVTQLSITAEPAGLLNPASG